MPPDRDYGIRNCCVARQAYKSATLRQAQDKLRRNCSMLNRTLTGASQQGLNRVTKLGPQSQTSNYFKNR
jgi:hypothetical protein